MGDFSMTGGGRHVRRGGGAALGKRWDWDEACTEGGQP